MLGQRGHEGTCVAKEMSEMSACVSVRVSFLISPFSVVASLTDKINKKRPEVTKMRRDAAKVTSYFPLLLFTLATRFSSFLCRPFHHSVPFFFRLFALLVTFLSQVTKSSHSFLWSFSPLFLLPFLFSWEPLFS